MCFYYSNWQLTNILRLSITTTTVSVSLNVTSALAIPVCMVHVQTNLDIHPHIALYINMLKNNLYDTLLDLMLQNTFKTSDYSGSRKN